MTLHKQIEHINNSLFAAKMANLIQYMYEDELKQAVAAIFKHMREEITANLEEVYGDVLFNAHMDLILAPIHENHKKYYDTIMKYKLREHRKGRTQGKRLVERAQKYAIQYSRNTGAIKADDKIPLNSLIQKDKLFATSDFSAEQMRDKTFVASENTLSRVDKDINGIITEGYREGLGINDVTNRVNTRFNQLESWEAQRIARTEIHGSHMQGVMNSYEEMGVEYTQWAAAHDNRTRDTHSAIDGEIIPWGGVFSNGLRYPGDTSGSISEWINCRCGVLPWFCPPGMMVPVAMSNFRESDLIPLGTLGNYEPVQLDNVDKVLNQLEIRSDKWDIYRLTPGERDVYIKAKKNYTILDDAIKNKNYSRLNDLEDDPMMFIRNKETFMTNTDNLTDFSLVKEEMAEYLEDILDYEKIIKDKNIKVDINPKGVKWNNPDLKEYRILNENKEYVPVNREEKFIKYYFKDENLTILESVDMEYSKVRPVYESYKKLPSSMKKSKEIVLSSQKPRIVNFWGSDSYVGGYVTSTKGSTRIVQFDKTINKLKDTLVHESAHLLEKDSDWFISNSKEYILAFKKDQHRLLAEGYTLKDTYVTPYAHDFTEEFVAKRSLAVYKYGDRQFSEEFAESVKMYLRDKESFIEKYSNKAKVIEKAIKGKYTPKNTTSYNSWFKSESDRFKLTEKEWERENLLKYKYDLTSSEMKELEYFDDKRKLDYLYNKKINGEIMDASHEKAFKDLTKKMGEKIKLPKDIIMEKNSPIDEFKLTSEEKIELKHLKSNKEELGFLEKMRLDELEEKEMFNRLNNKYITESKLSLEEAKEFRTLQNSMKINGFYEGELTSLNKLQGIQTKPKNIFNTVKPREPSKWNKNIESIKETSHSTVNNKKFINRTNESQEAIDALVEKQKLTGHDKELAMTWSGDANISMNQYIKGEEITLRYGSYHSVSEVKEDVDDLIKLIDNMPKNKCIFEDTLFFRGINDDRIDLNMFVPNSKPKTLNSFTSTSYDVDTADDFAQYTDIDGAQGWILKVHAPKGTKGVAINGELGNAGEEYEYLLSPNQKYITHSVDEKNKIIEIELIN